MRQLAIALAAGACLWPGLVLAHEDHPHAPDDPKAHSADEPPPPEASEASPGGETESDKAKTAPPPPRTAPAPQQQPSEYAGTDEEGWRPKTLANNTWRQTVRQDEESDDGGWSDFGHFYVELRFGPYSPNIDDDPAAGGLYEKYFGSEPLFYFGLEVDWLPVYIPYVGSIGPGFGWGVTSASGKAKIAGTTTDAGSDTGLTMFPMYAAAVFRADGILRELHVPIVPYIKGGFGFGVWSASGPNADSQSVAPEGMSTGLHLAIGGALALNAFDRSAAMAMYEATGIRYANLWGEWMFANLGSGDQLPIGTSTVVVGLALDF
jgi:hypothetical protein